MPFTVLQRHQATLRFRHCALLIAMLGSMVTSHNVPAAEPTQPSAKSLLDATAPAPPVAAKPSFEHVGPKVGEQLPDLRLRSIDDQPQRLGDAWRHGPALLVTSSLTCPKSRSRWPELAEIEKKYGEKINVALVYVIEAHPVGSICPYKGVEDITPENERDGLLRKQPRSLEDRLELAKEFKRYLRINVPIYVDRMDNRAWKGLGAAPNIALLVNEKGIVVTRQGWFDGPELQKAIDSYLASQRDQQQQLREKFDKLDEQRDANRAKLDKADLRTWDLRQAVGGENADELAAILKRFPDAVHLVLEADRGLEKESTLLMQAASQGNVAAAELLLKHGADIHAKTSHFDSVLQAANFGNLEMVKLLLRHKANVNVPATGRTPLHEALIAGKTEAAKLLIEAGAKEDFYSDIALGKIEAVRKALAADPSMASRPDGASRMPLDYAAANDQLETAALLIEHGAPVVDYTLSAEPVPLHYAIRRGSAPMVNLLLKSGHSPDTAEGWARDSSSRFPALHMAIAGDQLEIVKLLLALKADLKVRDTYSQMPLHSAAGSGKARMVNLLIQAGADVKATTIAFDLPCGSGEEATPQHNTPLHFAAASGNPQTIKALLAGGADIDTPNVRGETPLMSTISPPIYTGVNEKEQLANAETLLSAGANVNAKNEEGQTALDLVSGSVIWVSGEDARKDREKHLTDLLKKYGAKSGKWPPLDRDDSYEGKRP